MRNDYECIKISKNNLHVGNGAKDTLKKENRKYNFKFYYKVDSSYKYCSSGFNEINDFINFIKPINNKYYIYEYIFENKPCIPYFDYEYELENKPTDKILQENLLKIINLMKEIFTELFNVKLDENKILITSSHGFKNDKFKVSFHIVVTGYFLEKNSDCEYIYHKLKETDNNFDGSVYSKDRMMRCVLSAKNWDDERTLMPVNNNKITIKDIETYLITNVKEDYIKLNCPNNLKKQINKKKYEVKITQKETSNEIGNLIEVFVKKNFHEDSYFTKSIVKYDDIIFYGFNYIDRINKCFTGFQHDKIGFYCYLDSQNNILLKCFSNNCKGNKKIIGNLNVEKLDDKVTEINTIFLNENNNVIDKLHTFIKSLVIKSNMGTGKTQIVCDYIEKNNPKRILWISTRQTYSYNVIERIKKYNFINYLDDKQNFMYKDRVLVQLESLHLLEKMDTIKTYDLIILDEIESVLYQFNSSTIYEYSENTFNLLYFLCKNENTKIIFLDGDINKRSIEFVKDIRENYDIIINKYIPKKITLNITDNKDYYLNKIIDSIDKKRKICIISLTTKLMSQLEKILIDKKVNYLAHASYTDDKLKKDLANVNELWIKYDVVLYSPTISVGVDFTKEYFDDVFAIIVPNVASPRIFKQMLGRIRNMKNKEVLVYHNGLDCCLDGKLYNYEEMKDYFKYCDPDIKTNKNYILNNKENTIEVVSGFTLYDRIMMHNKIEDMNKNVGNFMSELNNILRDSNYELIFLNKFYEIKKAPLLDDDAYKNKILNAKNLDLSIDKDREEIYNIQNKILKNEATETEKFILEKQKFKTFWNLKEVDSMTIDLYFRQEFTLNRLLFLLNEIPIGTDYQDYNIHKKTEVIKNIITTLGFNLKDLKITIAGKNYYDNVKKLFSKDNQFNKDYKNIRLLFEKDKHELKETLTSAAATKLINNFFDNFGLSIVSKKTTEYVNKKNKTIYIYSCKINNIFTTYIN
jgi:hypothetical protein